MNNIQANTTTTFPGFGILSGTQSSTVQNGSSTWTAAFPNFLQVLLGSVQPEAKPADADAYDSESTNGAESFRRTGSTQSKDAAKTSANDTDSLAGTFMRSMLAVNLALAPVPQFVPVSAGSTAAATSGWNAVSGTASVSASAVESSTSATEMHQATATVPVRNEEMSAPKANVIPVEIKPATEMNSAATADASPVQGAEPQSEEQSAAKTSPTAMVNARLIRAGQPAVGKVAFELNLEAKQSVANIKPVVTDNVLFAKQQFTQDGGEELSPVSFKGTVQEAYSPVEPAAATTFTIPTAAAEMKPQVADAPKETSRASEPPATALSEKPAVRPHTVAVQEIGLRIGPESAPVDVTLRTRGGEVHVAVRTANPALETSLREELGTLVKALERSGFDAKSFPPAIPASPSEFDQSSNVGSGSGRGNRNSSRDQRPKQNHRRGTFEFVEAA